jgi:predicted nucleic acid-binding protein
VARAEVLDTSVLIHVIRAPSTWPAFEQDLLTGRLWLSSVVVAELYAGTRSRQEALQVEHVAAAMRRIGRLLTPTHDEWAQAGRLMARCIRLQGELRPRDHLADLLILLSAARLNGAVLTLSVRHCEAWTRLAVRAGLDVVVSPYQL